MKITSPKNENKALSFKPYGTKGFGWHNQNENEIKNFPKIAIKNIKDKVKLIKKIKRENRTFENTIKAYEELNIVENTRAVEIYALSMLSVDIKIRDAARKALEEYNKSMVSIAYDIDLYKSVMEYVDTNLNKIQTPSALQAPSPREGQGTDGSVLPFGKLSEGVKGSVSEGGEVLDSEDEMLIDDIVKGFKTMGFHLHKDKRDRLQAIEKAITKQDTAYDKAVNEYKEFILASKEELSGVPENITNSFAIDTKTGKYKITTDYPIYGPVMKYCKDRSIREKLYILSARKGGEKNVSMLEEVIKLRKEKSDLLGHPHHAAYRLEHRMAKSAENVYEMLDDILAKLKDKKDIELHELNQLATKLDNITELKIFDIDYYSNILKENKYNYSVEEVKEYFELDHTLKEMFQFFGELLDFKIEEKGIRLWHKDVMHYNIRDNKNNIIAELVLDLFPREGKYGHACMFSLNEGKKINDKKHNYDTPVVVLVCNFPVPQVFNINGAKKKTSFVNLQEVETLYHEFGHGMHGLLTRAKYTSHSGTNVVRDFVEVPSQTMEEFLGDAKFLKSISRHYETGKSMPNTLIDKIVSSAKFMNGYKYTRQAVLATLDLDLYTYKSSDPVAHYKSLMKKHLMEVEEKSLFVSSFSHIVSGYDAGYYGYLYAERICKDFYSVFKNVKNKKDLKEIGKRYRQEILEKGGSREELTSAHLFLGRPISNQAFIDDVLG